MRLEDHNVWRDQLYASYVSSGQGGKGAADQFLRQKPFYRRIVRSHVPKERKCRILDLACGAGGMLLTLKEMGYTDIRGVDLSEEMISLANANNVAEAELGDIFEFLQRSEEGAYDVIFAMDVMEHLTRDQLFRLTKEISRVLSPSGRLVIHAPNAEGVFGSKVRYADLTHELAFTEKSISQLLKVAGFRSVLVFEDRPVPSGLIRMLRWLIWVLGTLPIRVLHAAETGSFRCILSQNLTAVGKK